MTGTVRFFDIRRGFGFIAPDGGGTDVFVHVSAVETAGLEALLMGERVSYGTKADRQGRSAACNLVRI